MLRLGEVVRASNSAPMSCELRFQTGSYYKTPPTQPREGELLWTLTMGAKRSVLRGQVTVPQHRTPAFEFWRRESPPQANLLTSCQFQ